RDVGLSSGYDRPPTGGTAALSRCLARPPDFSARRRSRTAVSRYAPFWYVLFYHSSGFADPPMPASPGLGAAVASFYRCVFTGTCPRPLEAGEKLLDGRLSGGRGGEYLCQ